jgi:hypothetical protein
VSRTPFRPVWPVLERSPDRVSSVVRKRTFTYHSPTIVAGRRSFFENVVGLEPDPLPRQTKRHCNDFSGSSPPVDPRQAGNGTRGGGLEGKRRGSVVSQHPMEANLPWLLSPSSSPWGRQFLSELAVLTRLVPGIHSAGKGCSR